jgi:hypothetical protein
MKKRRIIFENPETRNRDSVVLDDYFVLEGQQEGFDYTEFSLWKANYQSLKATDMVMLPKYGQIQKSAIKGFVELKESGNDLREGGRTRFETSPPSKEEWEALLRASYEKFKGKIGTPLIVNGVAMSLWNLNNQRTDKALEFGRRLVAEDAKNDSEMGQI